MMLELRSLKNDLQMYLEYFKTIRLEGLNPLSFKTLHIFMLTFFSNNFGKLLFMIIEQIYILKLPNHFFSSEIRRFQLVQHPGMPVID